MEFVALETSSYESRRDFVNRLHAVIAAVEESFRPANVQRFGLRYIARMTGDAVERVGDLLRPEILGIARTKEAGRQEYFELGNSALQLITQAQFLVGNRRHILGRWGQLPNNATYDPAALDPVENPSWVLDLDMFTSEALPFATTRLSATAREFAETLYWLFRQMVTDEFLKFYGGDP